MSETPTCPVCGNEYAPRHDGWKQVCLCDLSAVHYSKRETHECEWCGETIDPLEMSEHNTLAEHMDAPWLEPMSETPEYTHTAKVRMGPFDDIHDGNGVVPGSLMADRVPIETPGFSSKGQLERAARFTIRGKGDNATIAAKLREFAGLIEACPEPCGMMMAKFEEADGAGITTIEINAPPRIVFR